MREEIFGPILPVLPYRSIDDAVAYINARPRPLALYFFGPDGPARRQVLERTTSGGVSINDTLLHYAQDDIPFGGVGASGMGAYHGQEGFRRMVRPGDGLPASLTVLALAVQRFGADFRVFGPRFLLRSPG